MPSHPDPLNEASLAAAVRTLEARDPAPPYGFDEFRRRAAARALAAAPASSPVPAAPTSRRAVRVLRIAAAIAPLALILLIADVASRTGTHQPPQEAMTPPLGASAEKGPALVRAGAAATIGELEDQVAWFDAMLSQAWAVDLPDADRAALARSRDSLAASVQSVRQAQALLVSL